MALPPYARTALSYILLFFFIFLLFPTVFFKAPESGVDPSWMVGMNLAQKYKLDFGRDVVYTYGPLGIFKARYSIYVSKFAYLAGDLFFLAMLFLMLKDFLKKNFQLAPVIFIFLCFLLDQNAEVDQWHYFFLLYFLIAYVREPDRFFPLALAGLESFFCLFYKANAGIVAMGLVLATIHYALATKKLALRSYAVVMLSYIASLLITARFLRTELTGFVKGGLQFIAGYADAMAFPLSCRFGLIAGSGSVVIVLLLLAAAILVFVKFIRNRNFVEDRDTFFIYCLVGISAFVWFKSGLVRSGHARYFFYIMGPLALLLYLQTPATLGKKAVAALCWGILTTTWVVMSILPPADKPNEVRFGLPPLLGKLYGIKVYFIGWRQYDEARRLADSTAELPNPFKAVIGLGSTDVFPSEISRIYFKGLRYDPRPSLQSYAAYNVYLDSIDAVKYTSTTAPDFVLYDYQSVDDRFAWLDESRTKLALLTNYAPVTQIEGELVLRKRKDPKVLIKSAEQTLMVKMGQEIPVRKSNSLQFSRFLIDFNLTGKLRNFFFQPPLLKISITLENGETRSFKRAVRSVLADGVILNKYVEGNDEFQLMLLSEGKANYNIRSVRIEPADSARGFKTTFRMINTWYIFGDPPPSERLADSLRLASLTDRSRPLEPFLSRISDSDQDHFLYSLDYFVDQGGYVRMTGWAFKDNDNNKNLKLQPIARSVDDGRLFALPAITSDRLDVAELRRRTDLGHAGFTSLLCRSQLPPGNYQIGLTLCDTDRGKNWIIYTDYYISEHYPQAMPPIDRTATGDDKIALDIVTAELPDYWRIAGWAVRPGATAPINLILSNGHDTYRIGTDLKRRMDIVGKYKNAAYEFSGFYVLVPKDSLPKGEYSVAVEKVDPDGSRHYRLTANKLYLTSSKIIDPVKIAGLPLLQHFSGDIAAKQDSDYNSVTVGGWAINDLKTVRLDSIRVLLVGKNGIFAVPAQKTSRPDVTLAYHNGLDLDSCGFLVKIGEDWLPKGKYQLGIQIYQHGTSGVARLMNLYIENE
jgi:hypothetical protein